MEITNKAYLRPRDCCNSWQARYTRKQAYTLLTRVCGLTSDDAVKLMNYPRRPHISHGRDNRKFADGIPGAQKLIDICSVSLPPVVTCPPRVPCIKDCYACKMQSFRKNIGLSWRRNYAIYLLYPDLYFDTVRRAAEKTGYFRFHVAGDIPDARYYARMLAVAEQVPNAVFLAFTKRRDYWHLRADAPKNLQLIASVWRGYEHDADGLPTAHVLYRDGKTTAPDGAYFCGGNCAACARAGAGCWTLKPGESVVFRQH